MELRPKAQTKAHDIAATMTITLKSIVGSWDWSWHEGALTVGLSVGDGEIWAMKKGMRIWEKMKGKYGW
jgi:hypothetical protein